LVNIHHLETNSYHIVGYIYINIYIFIYLYYGCYAAITPLYYIIVGFINMPNFWSNPLFSGPKHIFRSIPQRRRRFNPQGFTFPVLRSLPVLQSPGGRLVTLVGHQLPSEMLMISRGEVPWELGVTVTPLGS
jgi:hypothetical protein